MTACSYADWGSLYTMVLQAVLAGMICLASILNFLANRSSYERLARMDTLLAKMENRLNRDGGTNRRNSE